jgi:hypothetical protein
MAPSVEAVHPFEGMMHELPGNMSRQIVVVMANAANPLLNPGTVLGKVDGDNWTIHDDAAEDGSEVLAYGAAGILLMAVGDEGPAVTSLTGQSALVIFREAVVNARLLQWADGMDATAQGTAMATLRDTADISIDCRS